LRRRIELQRSSRLPAPPSSPPYIQRFPLMSIQLVSIGSASGHIACRKAIYIVGATTADPRPSRCRGVEFPKVVYSASKEPEVSAAINPTDRPCTCAGCVVDRGDAPRTVDAGCTRRAATAYPSPHSALLGLNSQRSLRTPPPFLTYSSPPKSQKLPLCQSN